jgi:hypothetical protein
MKGGILKKMPLFLFGSSAVIESAVEAGRSNCSEPSPIQNSRCAPHDRTGQLTTAM